MGRSYSYLSASIGFARAMTHIRALCQYDRAPPPPETAAARRFG
jgi:hypothetical protein